MPTRDTSQIQWLIVLPPFSPRRFAGRFQQVKRALMRSPVFHNPTQETSRESASYPPRRCLTAIFRARIERDGRLRRHSMDGVDHRFKKY
jgi:hypothetical protein